jgi:hypothetical protein
MREGQKKIHEDQRKSPELTTPQAEEGPRDLESGEEGYVPPRCIGEAEQRQMEHASDLSPEDES